mmetsp:Transcript_12341/g.22211  ORF Transcript_12341/g.22211 Transcript_12341/m.22211 type:complete len:761 (-) Transcript_12341:339-2621(-)|eukprot:CAMPEP_0177763144 /NCGR_PEP_ID=MMETSP0491_2-20121128/6717_1 /TAXON_ID=63592 /ORGANISM="Tetraselmis chuii, Strain PLY429" /LENGTH=760 /DNA_ID=CAMNT_0019279237 /DNA_START=147 /DNA_END=2429 /DNA_ORIENTATION=+
MFYRSIRGGYAALVLAAILVSSAADSTTAGCDSLLIRTNTLCDPVGGNMATCCSSLHLFALESKCFCEKPSVVTEPGLAEHLLMLQELCVDAVLWDPEERMDLACGSEATDEDFVTDEDVTEFRQRAPLTGSADSDLYPTDSADGCDGEDFLCQSLMKAAQEHQAYEAFSRNTPASATEDIEDNDYGRDTLGDAVSEFLEKEVATGDLAQEITDTVYEWATGMMKDIKKVVSAVDVFRPLGFSLDSLDIEIDTEEEKKGNAEEDDDELEIEIDIDFDMDAEALKNAVMELDLEIDDSLTPEQLRKVPDKIAQALGKAHLPKELMKKLPELVQQYADKTAQEAKPELRGHFLDAEEKLSEELEVIKDDDARLDIPTGMVDSFEDYGSVDDDGEGKYWEKQPQWKPLKKEHKVPITVKSATSLTPLTLDSDLPVRLEINPNNAEEVFVIIEADENDDVVLTLENESGEVVNLVVEDDVAKREANVDLASGNSAIIRSGDTAEKGSGFSVDVVPYLLEKWEQVTAAVQPLKDVAASGGRTQELSLEVTATHEIRVHDWQSGSVTMEDIELVVETSGAGAGNDAGSEVYDIVIDLDTSGEGFTSKSGNGEDRITIELEVQLDSAEDLDITVDIERAITEGDVRPDGEADPYVVIEHLQDYIFRLECVFVLVYTTVCLALMAIFYYLYQLFTSATTGGEEEEEEEEGDEESFKLAQAANEMIVGAQTTLNVLFARDLSAEDKKAASADGFYVSLPDEDDVPQSKQ